ncbi:MAG TPA: NAD(P)H-hydrate epimerase, partial [Rhodocyclaceae bacterium]
MIAAAPILRAPALRAVETAHGDADPPLMERAGAAAAAIAARMLPRGGDVLVVAGPGNNGGDAFVVARLLKEGGHRPAVVFAGSADKLPADARAAHDGWLSAGGTILDDIPERRFKLVVDGLFGIGLTRPVGGRHAELVGRVNRLGCPVLALDVPSGLDSETGRMLGCAVRADRTATFIALKPGLLTLDGPDCCGEVSLHALDVENSQADGVRLDRSLFRAQLKPRLRNTHKGSFGSV